MHAINVPTPTTCSSPIKPDISTISSAVQRGFKFGRRHSRFVNQGFFCNGGYRLRTVAQSAASAKRWRASMPVHRQCAVTFASFAANTSDGRTGFVILFYI
jgi:hypothetical protein